MTVEEIQAAIDALATDQTRPAEDRRGPLLKFATQHNPRGDT